MQEGEKVAHRESGVVGTLVSAGQGSAAVEWIGLPWVDYLPLCDLVSLERPRAGQAPLDHILELTDIMLKGIATIHRAADNASRFAWRREYGQPIDRAAQSLEELARAAGESTVKSLEELAKAVGIEISAFV